MSLTVNHIAHISTTIKACRISIQDRGDIGELVEIVKSMWSRIESETDRDGRRTQLKHALKPRSLADHAFMPTRAHWYDTGRPTHTLIISWSIYARQSFCGDRHPCAISVISRDQSSCKPREDEATGKQQGPSPGFRPPPPPHCGHDISAQIRAMPDYNVAERALKTNRIYAANYVRSDGHNVRPDVRRHDRSSLKWNIRLPTVKWSRSSTCLRLTVGPFLSTV